MSTYMSTYKSFALFFAKKAQDEENEFEPNDLSNLKLQKLLYYAQGWSLVYLGTPLFSEKILAWQHGPVVAEAYQDFKNLGREAIRPEHIQADLPKESQIIDLLERVYATYAVYSAWGLREMTHEEKPWKETYHKELGGEITLDSLRAFFTEKAEYEKKQAS
jgi:uncharacterized phage-associated protein